MNINHILIQTSNLLAMSSFIGTVADLTAGSRPPFPFPGVWMYHKDKPVIHLVEAHSNPAQTGYLGSREINSGGAVDHLAFEGDDYNRLIARLVHCNIDYVERTVPLSQEHQVFIDGPDGIKIEILFTQDKTPLNFS